MTAELSEIDIDKTENNHFYSSSKSAIKNGLNLLKKIDLRRHLSEVELILIEGALKRIMVQ